MPWRKYRARQGKYGPIYHVAKGVQIRRDARNQWSLFVDRDGSRTNRTVGTGRDALIIAIKAGEKIAAQLGSISLNKSTESPMPKMPGFRQFSKGWFELNSKRWDASTIERYEAILRLHIWPSEVFHRPIDKISRKDIKQHLRQVYKKRSPATVEAVQGVISGIFEEAIDDEILGGNPARGLLKKILPPKRQRDEKEPAPFTRAELKQFLCQVETTCSWREQPIFKVMAYAGLRLGEALAFRLRNLNFGNMTYHVAESYKLGRFKKPKFSKTRIVDLPEYLVEELKDYVRQLQKERLRQCTGGSVDRLFVDPAEHDGLPFSQRKVQGLMKKICKAAGLSVRNPHDLRHTYATLLLMAHQSPGYVQKQLGHSSIAITMDIYCHWIPGEGRGGLEEALGGGTAVQHRVRNSHISAYNKKRSQ